MMNSRRKQPYHEPKEKASPISGTTFEREGVQKRITGVEAGNVGIMIVKDRSRLGRNYLKVGFYTDIMFPEKGVRL